MTTSVELVPNGPAIDLSVAIDLVAGDRAIELVARAIDLVAGDRGIDLVTIPVTDISAKEGR